MIFEKFRMTDFEKEIIKRANKHEDAQLTTLCMNMINRNRMLSEKNAKLMLNVAPAEWGQAGHYKNSLKSLGKDIRKIAREYMACVNNLAQDPKHHRYLKSAESRVLEVEKKLKKLGLPSIYPESQLTPSGFNHTL